ncbi:MAG TPA: FMN-binding protein [Pseudonocardiaceae bacterium]|nr:FMN-binding protein [Pseudonocardiaceae bacterium]
MRRTTLALVATTAGIALLIGVKALSAGPSRSALAAIGAPQPTTSSHPPRTSGSSAPAKPPATGRYTGSPVDNPYGTIQVQAVLTNGKLTNIVVLQQTSGGRSDEIDAYALPVLKSEALTAQSANIDVVSGATYTSQGYAQSLQAALDAAGR